jgi:hypothetical protein
MKINFRTVQMPEYDINTDTKMFKIGLELSLTSLEQLNIENFDNVEAMANVIGKHFFGRVIVGQIE